ncbi:MAG TPA: type I glyceraldehyde-3-phosphate dehydrogenase [Patescibacteria group bacterium]|nr:type I glyceraldehyde-3-phosphate dehydrogenase [Patescibacteria group bacterium]
MTKIAINGFGRIGRTFFRAIYKSGLEISAINDLVDLPTLAHLAKFDSTYGEFEGKIEVKNNQLVVDGKEIKVSAEKDPANLPWGKLGIDVVVESTGIFLDYNSASAHLKAGAKLVVISAPSKDSEKIKTFVLGANHQDFDPGTDKIVSMASCTTNCLVPVAKVLDDNFKIIKASMNTIHSSTMDQRLQDAPHKDLRRARSALQSIIPTTTGATTAAALVLPQLKDKMDGVSLRVPTPTVSVVDFVALVEKKTTIEEINEAFRTAAKNVDWMGSLQVCEEPLVSVDFKGNPAGSIIDLASTQVIDGDLVRVLSWYDNEMGYSHRLAEFIKYIGSKLPA